MFTIDLPVYWVCLVAGTVLLLLAVVLGDLFDGIFGALGIDFDTAGGGSAPPILAFFALFGAGGLIGDAYHPMGLHSSLVGLAFGVAGALGAFVLWRAIRGSEGSPVSAMTALVGRDALVTVAVRPGGNVGEVELAVRGTTERFLALSTTGEFAPGSLVRVTGVAGTTLVIAAAAAQEG